MFDKNNALEVEGIVKDINSSLTATQLIAIQAIGIFEWEKGGKKYTYTHKKHGLSNVFYDFSFKLFDNTLYVLFEDANDCGWRPVTAGYWTDFLKKVMWGIVEQVEQKEIV